MMAELDAICVEPLSIAKSVMIPSNIYAPKVIDGKQHIYAYVDGEAKYVPIRLDSDIVNSSGTIVNAKYDENGTMIDIETKECGIFAPHGNAAFIEIGKDVDTAAIKFFLWEDETIRPLASEEM